MDQPVLTDKNKFPTEEIIFSHIGKTKVYWESFFKYIHINHPDFFEQWRYYNDGKSWLLKTTHKSKTIFWLSVINNSFRVTFYFSDKSEPDIINSTISDELKKQYKEAKRFGKIRGLTILMNNKRSVESAKKLILIKQSIK